MLKRLFNYLPSLNQCWVIVFFLIVVGGLGVGTLLSVICGFLGVDAVGINPLLSYVLPIIPALLYIYFSASETADDAPIGFKPGNLGYYPLYAAGILALGFVTEPLSSIFPMPEYLLEIFEKIWVIEVHVDHRSVEPAALLNIKILLRCIRIHIGRECDIRSGICIKHMVPVLERNVFHPPVA